jgi:hypothetical protein
MLNKKTRKDSRGSWLGKPETHSEMLGHGHWQLQVELPSCLKLNSAEDIELQSQLWLQVEYQESICTIVTISGKPWPNTYYFILFHIISLEIIWNNMPYCILYRYYFTIILPIICIGFPIFFLLFPRVLLFHVLFHYYFTILPIIFTIFSEYIRVLHPYFQERVTPILVR